MTLHTLILIIVWVWAIILFGGLVFITFLIGRHTIKNNPKYAIILLKNGNNIDDVFKGKLYEESKKGCIYSYNNDNLVFIPSQYNEVYLKNKRLLFVSNTRDLIALPFDRDTPVTTEEATNIIYELCSGHIGADGIRTVKSKKNNNVIFIALVSFIIGAVIVFGITQFQAYNQTKQSTPITQQAKPAQTPIEVK